MLRRYKLAVNQSGLTQSMEQGERLGGAFSVTVEMPEKRHESASPVTAEMLEEPPGCLTTLMITTNSQD